MYECENRKSDEFWEFGHKNHATQTTDMGSRSFRGKIVFSGGSGVIREFLEWLEGLGAKDRGSSKIWGFFGDFCGILESLERFRTYLTFRKPRALLQNL
jgi:hypothetical protein